MKPLLRPGAIAIVGASADRAKLTGQLIPLLRTNGFEGQIYPVNPKYKEICGIASAASLKDIDGAVDHCIVATRQELVEDVLAECVAKQIPAASIFASGYAEVGEAGRLAEERLAKFRERIIFLGPNCMGFANFVDGIVATATPVFERHSAVGDIALVSQSGGLAFGSLAFLAVEHDMGFSFVVNTGNAAGVDAGDLYDFLCADECTKVVVFLVENERLIAELCRSIRRGGLRKPAVLLKLGQGPTGQQMAKSHTGALSGDQRVALQAAQQLGIVCVDDLADCLGAISLIRAGIISDDGDRIGAVSISGGSVTLTADVVDRSSLAFARFNVDTIRGLRAVLPEYMTVHNPVDVTNLGWERPDLHMKALELVINDPDVRILLPLLTIADDYTEVCSAIADLKKQSPKPVAVVWIGGSYDHSALPVLRAKGIPVFDGPASLVRAFEALRGRSGSQTLRITESEVAVVEPSATEGTDSSGLTESQAYEWLCAHGLPMPSWRKAQRSDLAQITAAANEVGYPVVLKADVVGGRVSDRGGVLLDLRTDGDVRRAAELLAAFPAQDVLVVQYVRGSELFVSVFRHPTFGWTLAIGSGGRLVELIRDVRFVNLPATREQIRDALTRTALGAAMATSFRGISGAQPTMKYLWQLVQAATADEDLMQVELNPLIVDADLAIAVDANIFRKSLSL
jgi:acetate---CoA ligase (ADP-forming)